MCMPLPEGYGSISSWYQWRLSSCPGSGFGVWNVRSSSQMRCHFGSICWGSYLSVLIFLRPLATKKPLDREARWKLARPVPRRLPALVKELLSVHLGPEPSNSLTSSHGELHETQPARRGGGSVSEVRHHGDVVPQRPRPAGAGELGPQLPPARPELPRAVRASPQPAGGDLRPRRGQREA